MSIFRPVRPRQATPPPRGEGFAATAARADAARDRSDWEAAVAGYHAALSQNPSAVGLHVQLGHALKESGDFAGALAAYERYLERHPEDVDVHLQIGHLHNRFDDPPAALEWYEKALLLDPANDDIASHVRHAAESVSRAARETERSDAMRLVEMRRWADARAALVRLIDAGGQDDLTGILGNVCKEQGDFAAAEESYCRYRAYATEHAPEMLADVEIQCGHLAKVQRDYWRAVVHFVNAQSALELDHLRPGNDTLLSELILEIAECKKDVSSVFL